MNKKIGRKIDVGEISGGLLEKTVDLALISIYFGFEFAMASKSSYGLAGERAFGDLDNFDYHSLRRAISQLKRKGLVQTVKEGVLLPFITDAGKEKLKNIVPFYDSKRIWDKRVYLVTYDIPNSESWKRVYLRKYLKKIGCGMLQESVWLTPYNPRELIEEFVEKNNIEEGLVIVSSIGKDGGIGKTSLNEVLERVFKLDEINDQYSEFLSKVQDKKQTKESLIFTYLSILRGDPQLPFELLPEDWLGDKAYKVFKEVGGK